MSCEDLSKLLSESHLLFRVEDYEDLVYQLQEEHPEARTVMESGFSGYEPWMERIGAHLFIQPEHRLIKEELEDLLFTKDLRYALEALIYLKDPPEKIVRKLAMKFASAVTTETIKWYERIFWSQDLSLEEWRVYSSWAMSQEGQDSAPIHFVVKTKSAHAIEASLGLDAEVEPMHLLKEGLVIVYDRLMAEQALGEFGNKGFYRTYDAFLKTINLLSRNKEASNTDLSHKISQGFRRTRADREDLNQLSLLEDGQHTPLPPTPSGGAPLGGAKDPPGMVKSTAENPLKLDGLDLPEGEYLI